MEDFHRMKPLTIQVNEQKLRKAMRDNERKELGDLIKKLFCQESPRDWLEEQLPEFH